MALKAHRLLSQNDTDNGKGIHPQLSLPDFADETARLAYTQSGSDRGRMVWQTSDSTTWQADGVGGWKEVAAPTGAGQANTASNVGGGAGVFKQKTGVDLELRSVVGGAGITAVENADDINLSVDDGADGTAIHDNVAGEIAAVTAGTVASGDLVLIEDVDDSNNKKRTTAQAIADLGGAGGLVFSSGAAKTALYTIPFGEIVRVDPSGGAFNLEPTSSPSVNDKLGIKNITSSTNAITFDADGGGKLVDGQLATFLSQPYECQIYQYNGTQWSLVSEADTGGATSVEWPILQQLTEDFAFAQAGSEAKSIAGLNLSEGILAGACMCQVVCRLMGNATGGATGIELYAITLSLAADGGGDEPWERVIAGDEVAVVRDLDSGNSSHVSCNLNDFTNDALSQIEMNVSDTNLGDGAWTVTMLVSRSIYIPTP